MSSFNSCLHISNENKIVQAVTCPSVHNTLVRGSSTWLRHRGPRYLPVSSHRVSPISVTALLDLIVSGITLIQTGTLRYWRHSKRKYTSRAVNGYVAFAILNPSLNMKPSAKFANLGGGRSTKSVDS
ncbi:hypothetical protein SCLCIDRAFT_1216395 [Scleroderma citrinum Foug A]|uniref:Uncharacterized protein n=1 Tax=Scleroderma citrinum Foug A TaxID=1036808 RepID=A0A0C3DYC0_9AGAM|nr:hypothetical protein SCLCIDRAFT_1216395 [Scleroderma citrinum Foug A]